MIFNSDTTFRDGFFNGGRLSVDSANPLVDSTTTSSTIYWVPWKSNSISLYDGSSWRTVRSAAVGVSITSGHFRAMDVFGYLSSGSLALEISNWNHNAGNVTNVTAGTPITITSNSHGLSNGHLVGIYNSGTAQADGLFVVENVTTNTFDLKGSTYGGGPIVSSGTWARVGGNSNPMSRATALATQDGVYVKSGDATRLFLGTIYGNGSVVTDSTTNRGVWNFYNQVTQSMSRLLSNDHTWVGTSGGIDDGKLANSDAYKVISYVSGWPGSGSRNPSTNVLYGINGSFRKFSGSGEVRVGVKNLHYGLTMDDSAPKSSTGAVSLANASHITKGNTVPGINVIAGLNSATSASVTGTWYKPYVTCYWSC